MNHYSMEAYYDYKWILEMYHHLHPSLFPYFYFLFIPAPSIYYHFSYNKQFYKATVDNKDSFINESSFFDK